MRGQVRQVTAHQADAACRRTEYPRQQVDQGGFAGAIGADQGMSSPPEQSQIDMIGGHNAVKTLDQAPGLQHGRAHEPSCLGLSQ